MATGRPNILWVVLEDTSPRLGCYGDDVAETPTLDSLATEGRTYGNAFCTSPVCAPSRSSHNTGCYQTSIGSHHHRTFQDHEDFPGPYEAVPPHYVTLVSERLRRAGYFTTMTGSADFQHATPVSAWDRCAPAYESFYDENPDWFVDHEAAHWRERDGADQPFFSVFNPTMTHESGTFEDEGDNEEIITDPATVSVPPYLPDTEKTREAIARQYDNIARADDVVANLLGQLESDGLSEDTAVFVFADHGEGLPRGKRWLYDSGIQVPLLIRWPGEVDGGTDTDRLVSLVDLPPTLYSIAGLDVPAWMQGRAFLGPRSDEPRDYVFGARDRLNEMYDTVRAVRDQHFKYIRNYEPDQPYLLQNQYRNRQPVTEEILRLRAEGSLEGPLAFWGREDRHAEELYDLREDPHEVENLADDPAYEESLARFRAALDDWQARTGDRGLEPEAVTVEEMWPDGEQPDTSAPRYLPNAPNNRAVDPAPDGATLEAPAELGLHCQTQGAAVVYRTDDDEHWSLYTGPLSLPTGETTVRARAIRYGYAESPVVEAAFFVEG